MQTVKIKVGSVIKYYNGEEVINEIAFNFSKSKTVFFVSGEWDNLKSLKNVISIDGINVESIENIEV